MTGYDSKRRMAADKLHWSDCAVHNGPAYPAGLCDCGATEPWNEDEWRRNNWRCGHGWLRGEQCEICNAPQPAQEPVAHLWECLGRWSAYLVENGKQADCAPPSWLVDAINKATTPPLPEQEPDALTIAYQSGYYDGKQAALAGREWNFCERCGKRTNDIYTCTPPQGDA